MKSRPLSILFFASIFLFSGCAEVSIQKYAPIDRTAKTVTVPEGSLGVTGMVKQILAEDGWIMVVRRGPVITEGTVDRKVFLQSAATFNTRYTLDVRFSVYCRSLAWGPSYCYDLSMVDNKTGQEVLTSSVNIPGLYSYAIKPVLSKALR